MQDPRIEKLADVLINYSLSVQKDNLFRIFCPPLAMPLVIPLVRKAVAAGAHPFLRVDVEEIDEIVARYASEEQLRYISPLATLEVEKIDRHISIWAEENTRYLTSVDPRRLGIKQAARKPLLQRLLQRAADGEMKWTATQFPTNAAAQDAEMSLAEYENFVFAACMVDRPDPVAAWKQLSQRQQRLTDFLNGKKDYHVVAANGTDVRMSVADRRWINCDGHENFPDGEVFTGPVLDSVNGQINFSFPAVHHGNEVCDVKLTFRNGKVVAASASKGEDYLTHMLDTDAGSRFLGECAIGTNFGIDRYTRNTLFDEKIGGTVHFAVGAGYPETGNANESGLHWDMVVDLRQGGFVEIDGVKVNVDGKFMKEDWPGDV